MKAHPTASTGHLPTLAASTLHFTISFMVWASLGALGIHISESMGLSPAEKGLMVALPILSGSLLRVPFGILSDRIGGKKAGIAILAFLFLPLALAWGTGDNLPALLGIGLLLGTAGASFTVALPLTSRWYPPERQGLVMGIAAVGNGGTVIANLLAPRLANVFGWHNVMALEMVPLGLGLVAFLLMAKDCDTNSSRQPVAHYLAILKNRNLWWFCLFYSVTFGGYVGLSSVLPLFLRDQYGVSPVEAGYLTALAAFVGAGIRPLGGYLADRFGGARMLLGLLLAIGVSYLFIAQLPSIGVMVGLLVMGMAALGMGNGAVFQLVPLRFGSQIGVATGVVGALGGPGGFLLPTLLGSVKQISGSFGPGFVVLALVAFGAAVFLWVLTLAQQDWRLRWRGLQIAETRGEHRGDA